MSELSSWRIVVPPGNIPSALGPFSVEAAGDEFNHRGRVLVGLHEINNEPRIDTGLSIVVRILERLGELGSWRSLELPHRTKDHLLSFQHYGRRGKPRGPIRTETCRNPRRPTSEVYHPQTGPVNAILRSADGPRSCSHGPLRWPKSFKVLPP
jgi:hypothetical protein